MKFNIKKLDERMDGEEIYPGLVAINGTNDSGKTTFALLLASQMASSFFVMSEDRLFLHQDNPKLYTASIHPMESLENLESAINHAFRLGIRVVVIDGLSNEKINSHLPSLRLYCSQREIQLIITWNYLKEESFTSVQAYTGFVSSMPTRLADYSFCVTKHEDSLRAILVKCRSFEPQDLTISVPLDTKKLLLEGLEPTTF